MIYFNGFGLHGEEQFFKAYLVESDFTVAGFSYGAQKAFEYAYHNSERIDRLILLSPAFFQHQKASFVRTQLRYFKADREVYIQQFLKNVTYPSDTELSAYVADGSEDELAALLSYEWDREKLLELKDRGITIEVFIGGKDQIVDAVASQAFFSEITTTYFFKDFGHLLR